MCVELSAGALERRPGWAALLAAFYTAEAETAGFAASISVPGGQQAMPLQAFAAALEGAIAAALVWAQNARPSDSPAPEAGDAESEEAPAVEQEPIPKRLATMGTQLGLGRVREVCSRALEALAAVASAPSAAGAGAAAPALLSQLGPMLSLLRCALCQLGLRYLVAHKSVAKLAYVASSLFSGLVEEGFCMPEGTEGEGGLGPAASSEPAPA